VSLTYDGSAISAMLDDVWRDVGKEVTMWFVILVFRKLELFPQSQLVGS
jgi:hypothetical protein